MTEYITPPPELVEQWIEEGRKQPKFVTHFIAELAAQWGSDQELEACCDAIYLREDQPLCGGTAEWLRAARRPKPDPQVAPAGELVERVAELREKFEQLIKCSRAYDGYSTMTPVELADRMIDVVLKLEGGND